MVTVSALATFLEFAVETAHLAGRTTLGRFQAGLEAEFKPDDTPVTEADRKAEELIRARIEATYPGHGILGEEFGEIGAGASHRWLIDPIDGTKAFARGVPLYGVLIALEVEGRVEVGVAHFPALGDSVYAASGSGCFWNGRRCRVATTRTLSRAFVSCTDPGSFRRHGRQQAWTRLQRAAYHRAGWSDAYGHALVATGRLELMLDPVLNAWDAGPFPVILREAGGFFGDWKGVETIYGREGLSTTATLLPEVLQLIGDRPESR